MYDPPASKLITLVEAANHLGLTHSALRKAAQARTLWTIRIGHQHCTTIEQAENYRKLHADYSQSERMKDILKRKAERDDRGD